MRTILVTIAAFLIISGSSYAQTILVGGKPSTGKLVWSDFSGPVDKSSSFHANTSYIYNTKWGKVNFLGDSASIEGFEVVLQLDAKTSWAKKNKLTDELLVHEQGHFNIGILHAREVLKRVNESKFTRSNYNAGIQAIINETGRKYNDMTRLYDKETDHSKNKDQQAKWNAFFEEQKVL